MTACIDTIHIYYPLDATKGIFGIDIQDIVRIAADNGKMVVIQKGYIDRFSVWEARGIPLKFEVSRGLLRKIIWNVSGYPSLAAAITDLYNYDRHYDSYSDTTESNGLVNFGLVCRLDLFVDYLTDTAEIMSGLDIDNQRFILGMADYEEVGRQAGRFRSYRIGRDPVVFRIYDKYREASTHGLQRLLNNPTTRIEVTLSGKRHIRKKLGLTTDLRLRTLQRQLRMVLSQPENIFDGVSLRYVRPRPLADFKTELQKTKAIQFHRDLETGTFFDVRRRMNKNGNGSDSFYRKYFSIRRYPSSRQPGNALRTHLARYLRGDVAEPANNNGVPPENATVALL